MANLNYTCSLLAILGTVNIILDNFTKEEVINSSASLLAPILFENPTTRYDSISSHSNSETIEFEHERFEIRLSFDQSSFLWNVIIKNKCLELEATMLYPDIISLLDFCKHISDNLRVHERASPLTINSFLKEVFPYKLHYLIRVNSQLCRFSEYVLREIAQTKNEPLHVIRSAISLKPQIVNTNFSHEGLEKDFILTCLVLRNILPAYLLPRPNSVNKNLLREICEFLRSIYETEVILLESVEDCVNLLSLIFDRITGDANSQHRNH